MTNLFCQNIIKQNYGKELKTMQAIIDFFEGVDFTGLLNLIKGTLDVFANFDMKLIDTTALAALLDKFYPIWNPYWNFVNELLAYVGNF